MLISLKKQLNADFTSIQKLKDVDFTSTATRSTATSNTLVTLKEQLNVDFTRM